jgi:hypothetical protein
MRVGKSIVEMAQEIQRQQESKKDYIADTRALKMVTPNDPKLNQPRLQIKNGNLLDFPLRPYAHRQLGERLGIPAKYYDRMLAEAPDLLASNVNRWLGQNPERRMVRTLDGQVRGFLSDKFRPLENFDLFEAIFPVLQELNLLVVSADITETKMYIKAVDKSIERDIPTGRSMGDGTHTIFDTLSPAICISNSEIGAGTLSVETGVLTKGCTNLAFFMKAIRKYHIGAKADIGEEVYALLQNDTKRVTDAATWMQVRDVVKGAFEITQFDKLLDKIKGATQDPIEGDPVKVVELTAKHFSMTEGERGSVLANLIKGGDLTRYGLFNAVTRAAEGLDYDRASEFEQFGPRVIELPRGEWKQIAEAGKVQAAA